MYLKKFERRYFIMDLFVYSDESGVFDYIHNDYYVYGGLLFIGKQDKDNNNRKYLHAEKCVESTNQYKFGTELKASIVSNKHKGKLYRSLNNCLKFGAIVKQSDIHREIFSSKKSKQRYLDYVYKISIKRLLERLLEQKKIDVNYFENINFFVDEHTTATNGRYELREALLQELKYGTFNSNYNYFFEPILPGIQDIRLKFCNSATVPLIRAADIVANNIFHNISDGSIDKMQSENIVITYFP